MSHHFDTAIAREDPQLNLLDFYLFRGQPGTTVMAMTVNPNAGTKAPDTFHEEGMYAFRFDVNGDAHEEVTFGIRFGEVGQAEGAGPEGRHVQTLEVRRATGRDAAEGTEGDVIASGTTGRIAAGDAGARIFAGLAPDLFAANRTGIDAFRAAPAAGKFAPGVFHDGANYFQNRNVTAIVMEVPTQLIGDPAATARAWITVSLCGHAPYGTDLDNPDFAGMAKSAGLFGATVAKADELEDALRAAFGHDGPALVDVHTARQELALPPKLTCGQIKGFSLYATRTILSGGGEELVELAKTNLRELAAE
jgi:hypothetical protein